eukprot:scaffold26263_cov96-Isochrysis_galbana.AAC.1
MAASVGPSAAAGPPSFSPSAGAIFSAACSAPTPPAAAAPNPPTASSTRGESTSYALAKPQRTAWKISPASVCRLDTSGALPPPGCNATCSMRTPASGPAGSSPPHGPPRTAAGAAAPACASTYAASASCAERSDARSAAPQTRRGAQRWNRRDASVVRGRAWRPPAPPAGRARARTASHRHEARVPLWSYLKPRWGRRCLAAASRRAWRGLGQGGRTTPPRPLRAPRTAGWSAPTPPPAAVASADTPTAGQSRAASVFGLSRRAAGPS